MPKKLVTLTKKEMVEEIITIPVDLARLLIAKQSDFKDPLHYEAIQEISRELLKILLIENVRTDQAFGSQSIGPTNYKDNK